MSDIIFDDPERVRREIYRAFSSTGRAPTRAEVAVALGMGFDRVEAAFWWLAARQVIVLGNYAQIDLAPPFASVNMGFSVSGAQSLWWGASALDSFAIPHLVEAEPRVLVATACPGCRADLAWTVTRNAPPGGPQVAYFPTPAKRMWDDILATSRNQRIFCDRVCVERWLERTREPRGEVLGLSTLWRIAAHWYDGLLESPYSRREPAAEAAYFASLGLTGQFWGIPAAIPRRQAAHVADA